jgi:hypothetical protein
MADYNKCPFCGGSQLSIFIDKYVNCECGGSAPIAMWNHRIANIPEGWIAHPVSSESRQDVTLTVARVGYSPPLLYLDDTLVDDDSETTND